MRHIELITTCLILMVSCKSTKPAQTLPATVDPDITGTYWKLTELGGKAVTNPPANQKEAYFKLVKDGNKVEGTGGCNGFGGTYTMDGPTRIKFSQMRSTMMACPDMSLESEFAKVIETVDNYAMADHTLSLNKARMAPLAKFVAAPQPK
jgi:heat shock protein HslJ